MTSEQEPASAIQKLKTILRRAQMNLGSSPGERAPVLVSFAIASLLIIRLILFCSEFGAIEHDSGWYIGVAKNLAQHGVYASNVNTVIDSEKAGVHVSIFENRLSVQDDKGRIYFPAGVSVGPALIMPIAASIFLFGDSPWAYRLFPLVTCFGLFFLSFLFAARLGGGEFWISPLLFGLWVWFYPQFWMQLGYEALGEPTALFYFVLAAWLAEHKRWLAAGVLLALSIETKMLMAFGVGAFAIVAFFRCSIRERLRFAIGLAAPILAYETYRLVDLVLRFDLEAWKAVNWDIIQVFIHNGSGLEDSPGETFERKALVWTLLGFRSSVLPMFLILGSAAIGFAKRKTARIEMLSIVFTYVCIHFAWFFFKSPTGWGRHAWPALFLGLLLICIVVGHLIGLLLGRQPMRAAIALGFLAFGLDFHDASGSFRFDHDAVEKLNQMRSNQGLFGFPTSALFEFEDQREAARFIRKEIPHDARMHYVGGLLIAEMTAFTDHVFYPYAPPRLQAPPNVPHYVIMGPFQAQFSYSFVSPQRTELWKKDTCAFSVFENRSYFICRAK